MQCPALYRILRKVAAITVLFMTDVHDDTVLTYGLARCLKESKRLFMRPTAHISNQCSGISLRKSKALSVNF